MTARPSTMSRYLTALLLGLVVGSISWFIVRFAATDLIGPDSSMAGVGAVMYGTLSGLFAASLAFAARLAITIRRR